MVTVAAPKMAWPLLDRVDGPREVRRLVAGQLPGLAAEIGAFLVGKVTAAGGHPGPNLRLVELTLALHRVFDYAVPRARAGTPLAPSIPTGGSTR